MALVAGSSSEAFFCVASRMNVSERITSSSALMDFSRPTNSGTIMWGKTTMSRNGRTGYARTSPGVSGGRGLDDVMARFLLLEPLLHDPTVRCHGGVRDGPGRERGTTPRAPWLGIQHPARNHRTAGLPLLGGPAPGACQVSGFVGKNRGLRPKGGAFP